MPTKTRLPNKTLWTLERAIDKNKMMLELLRKCIKRAIQKMDAPMVQLLVEARDEARALELELRMGYRGEYIEVDGMNLDDDDSEDYGEFDLGRFLKKGK